MQALKQAYSMHSLGRIKEARQLYLQILAQRPDSPEANFLLGNLVFQLGELHEAETLLRKAVQYAPADVRHRNALGVLLLRLGQFAEAAQHLEAAVQLDHRSFDAWSNLGAACIKLNRFEQAEEALSRALKLRNNDSRTLNNLGNAYLGLFQIEASIKAYQAAFAIDRKLYSALSNALMNSNYLPHLKPEQLAQLHREAGQQFPSSDWQPPPARNPKKLRLGLLSADLRTHSVAYFLLPLLKHLDRERFSVIAFANDARRDVMTEQLQAHCDEWYEVASLSDRDLLAQMRAQNLDIVLDLSGHTGNNRLAVLSQRVARVQVNWLGYPHSTGIPAIDVRLVDSTTDPIPAADALASEKLLRLPTGFLCYEGDERLAVSPIPPYFNNGYITFGSFNNLAKVNDTVLECWADILKRTPDSHLLLKAKQLGEASVRKRILAVFEHAGVDASRIELMGSVPGTASHLELYSRMDIALDTFPYNGTTTTCEALWMGVPVIAFSGDRHAARVSVSILEQAGFGAFAGIDVVDYKRLAREWARKPEALQQLRQEMRQRLQKSDLCNARQFGVQMSKILARLGA